MKGGENRGYSKGIEELYFQKEVVRIRGHYVDAETVGQAEAPRMTADLGRHQG